MIILLKGGSGDRGIGGQPGANGNLVSYVKCYSASTMLYLVIDC